jgi:LytS/YehU family sensor histidine kinase
VGGRLKSPWLWLEIVATPLAHILAFALVAPLPWLFPRRLPNPWRLLLGLAGSILISEGLSVLLPVLDGWLLGCAGRPVNLKRVIDIYMSLVGPAMVIIGGLIASRAGLEETKREALLQAHIAKNRLLQSQVHPHVLFNALNGLAELVHKDAKLAERAIRSLSELLRRILRASEHETLPLSEEEALILDYLHLEGIRLGSRLRVSWEWDPALATLEVPPLLLQPLVENAIKHGIAPSMDGGEILLRAQVEPNGIAFEVWNSGYPYTPVVGSKGIGISNLRSRLGLVYGDRFSLSIAPFEGGTRARIVLDKALL